MIFWNIITHLLFCTIHVSASLGGILCRLPKDVGHQCGRVVPYSAYFFDSDVGECIEFVFQGCGGNANRFSTKAECVEGCAALARCGKGFPLMDFAGNIKRCDGDKVPCPGSHECVGNGMQSVCCLKSDRVCHQPVESGTSCGVPPESRFYYDPQSSTCRSFAYTGCGGNENNFKSKGLCMQFCSSEVTCKRGEPLPDRYSASRTLLCYNQEHCPKNYTCIRSSRGKGACCPSVDLVCGTPLAKREVCNREMETDMWTFNYKMGVCEKLSGKTCSEQMNSFANVEQCVDFCIGMCPNGNEVHINPFTNQPQLCDFKKKGGCPVGYECKKSSPFASICCRTPAVCPAAESLLLLKNEHAVTCVPKMEKPCPEGYTCQQASNREHICCTPALECPQGMRALREDGARPRVCTPSVPGSCPSDHLCVSGSGGQIGRGAKSLCCRAEQKCVVPYVDTEKKKPEKCFPGHGDCPSSTLCLPAVDTNETLSDVRDLSFYCCHTVDVFTCSEGGTPFIDKETKRPLRCNRSDPDACPIDFRCEALADGTAACCPQPAAQEHCLEAVVNNGEIIPCQGWADNTCPSGGKCRKASNGQYMCCRDVSLNFLDILDGSPKIPF